MSDMGFTAHQHKKAISRRLLSGALIIPEVRSDHENTLKCLSIGTPKIIDFPFVSNGKLMFFRGPNIQAHCNEAGLCLNFGTPENNEFSIWNKWKIYYF